MNVNDSGFSLYLSPIFSNINSLLQELKHGISLEVLGLLSLVFLS